MTYTQIDARGPTFIQTATPAATSDDDTWFDPDDGLLYVRESGEWAPSTPFIGMDEAATFTEPYLTTSNVTSMAFGNGAEVSGATATTDSYSFPFGTANRSSQQSLTFEPNEPITELSWTTQHSDQLDYSITMSVEVNGAEVGSASRSGTGTLSFTFSGLDISSGDTIEIIGNPGGQDFWPYTNYSGNLPAGYSNITVSNADNDFFINSMDITSPAIGTFTLEFDGTSPGAVYQASWVMETGSASMNLLDGTGATLVNGLSSGTNLLLDDAVQAADSLQFEFTIRTNAAGDGQMSLLRTLYVGGAPGRRSAAYSDLVAENSVTDPAGVQHTGELADLADTSAPVQWATTTQTAAYTAASYENVLADASGAGFAVTLPAPATDVMVTVKKIDGTANAVTVATPGTETIDGAADHTLGTQYDTVTVTSDGTNYFVV